MSFKCLATGHHWDIAYHGPGGSGFVCMRCPAQQHSGDKRRRLKLPWYSFFAKRRWKKFLKNAPPIKVSNIDDLF